MKNGISVSGEITRTLRVSMITSCLKVDGISSVIVNYCTHLKLDKVNIVIISGAPVAEVNRKKCAEYGIQLIELPERRTSCIAFYKALNQELAKGNYDICHVHGNSATSVVELLIARINHIKVRIMHCHNSQCQHMRMHRILAPLFKRMYTRAFACSGLAGEWIFGKKKFVVLPNAFEIENYKFDQIKREQYRKELNLEDAFVIGYLGRINHQKNCWHTIKCFEKYFNENPHAKLLLVGNGPDREEVEQYVKKSNYNDNIIFYGESEDVPGILSAMDIFLFPSRYEGLGISVIEAQINGMPCVISDAVPEEVQLSSQSVFLPIGDESIPLWVDKIRELNRLSVDREAFYYENREKFLKYDINDACKVLENLYFMYASAER